MLNQCNFIGNLGADPEIRSFSNGNRVCNLRLAVSERWKDKNTGERKENTEWVQVSIFSDGLINVAENYLKKGSKVFLQGALKTRKYTDQSGNDRYSTEIVLRGFNGTLTMLDGRNDSDSGQSGGWDKQSGGGQEQASQNDSYDDLDDDIPF